MKPEDEVAEIAELYFPLLDLLNLIETAAAFLLTSRFLIDLHSISSFSRAFPTQSQHCTKSKILVVSTYTDFWRKDVKTPPLEQISSFIPNIF